MKKWEAPSIKNLNVCCTQAKPINPICGGEVNVEGNGKVKCMDWTKGQQKFNDVCIYAKDKNSGELIYQMQPIPSNGNAYCSNYTGKVDQDEGISG